MGFDQSLLRVPRILFGDTSLGNEGIRDSEEQSTHPYIHRTRIR